MDTKLPKLPYGQGSYSWEDSSHTKIRFKKTISDGYNSQIISVSAKSIQECNKKMREKEAMCRKKLTMHSQQDPHNRTIPFAQAAYNWMTTFKSEQLKGKSYDTFESIYNCHIVKAPFADFQVHTIADVDIQKYLNDLKHQGYSFFMVKKIYGFINQFMNYYYKREPYMNPMLSVVLPNYNNDIKPDTTGKETSVLNSAYEILNDEEIEMFTHVATLPIIEGVQGFNHGWGLVFIMWTFIRYGEAMALQWKDVDYERKNIIVYKTYSRIRDREYESGYRWSLSTTKTRSSVRYIPLFDKALDALAHYKEMQKPKSEEDFIFCSKSGQPLGNSNMNHMLRQILKQAGINKKITVHGLRHTGISYLIRHNVDKNIVAKWAGHSGSDITMNVYYTILSEQEKNEIDKLNRVKNGDA